MKKPSIILTTLTLFAATLYPAFRQGALVVNPAQAADITVSSPSLYEGIQGVLVGSIASLINVLMSVLGESLLLSVIALALIVELVLLYPSIRIQLKQKKIHLLHKKLINRFKTGELAVSDTKEELNILYAVNQKIHVRGALLVALQLSIFMIVLWSLKSFALTYAAVAGPAGLLNRSLLETPVYSLLPLFAGMIYFFHSLIKIYYKQKEDYVSPTQSRLAIVIAILLSGMVYLFATVFPVLLTVYFVTLITFGTIRYIVTEHNQSKWGKLARKDLLIMLRNTKKAYSRLEVLSVKWSYFTPIRHINLHLLEEAASMSLIFMLILNVL